jgi:NodT family efflux transporter outer membrane factor (OMF) lipoprotein
MRIPRTDTPGRRSRALRALLRTALVAAIVATAGCVITPSPDGETIRAEALEGVKMREAWAAREVAGQVTDGWLADFADPALDALVAEAIVANPDLRAASTRIEQAQAQLDAAQAQLRPAISLLGSASGKAGSDFGGLRGAILQVSWELDLWGRLRYGRNAARETHAATQADYHYARQLLAARVVQTWYTATQVALQRDLARELVGASEQLVELADKRLDVGAGDERDVVLAQASANQYRDATAQLDQAYEQTLRALELLLGRYPAADVQARADLPPPPADVPTGQPLQMLERRPDLVAAERRVAAAFDRVGEARAAKLPSLTLIASGSYLESDVLDFKDDYETPSAGASARLLAPLYQGGALTAQVALRTAQQQEAVAAYAGAALAAIGDVENALAATRTLEQRRGVLELAVAQNQRALELEKVAYRVGSNDLRNVLRQQVALYGSNTALLAVRGDQLVQRATLYLALGGSFEPPEAAAPEGEPEDGAEAATALVDE